MDGVLGCGQGGSLLHIRGRDTTVVKFFLMYITIVETIKGYQARLREI